MSWGPKGPRWEDAGREGESRCLGKDPGVGVSWGRATKDPLRHPGGHW